MTQYFNYAIAVIGQVTLLLLWSFLAPAPGTGWLLVFAWIMAAAIVEYVDLGQIPRIAATLTITIVSAAVAYRAAQEAIPQAFWVCALAVICAISTLILIFPSNHSED